MWMKCYKNYPFVLLIHTVLWFSLEANTKHCLQNVLIVHITYLGHSLCTPGHPEQLLRSHPTIESPQISPRSSSASSGGSLLGSSYSPDVPFCSRLPTNRFLSAERSSNNEAWSYVGISGFNIIAKSLNVDSVVQRWLPAKKRQVQLIWSKLTLQTPCDEQQSITSY